jgi:hypothetical protein
MHMEDKQRGEPIHQGGPSSDMGAAAAADPGQQQPSRPDGPSGGTLEAPARPTAPGKRPLARLLELVVRHSDALALLLVAYGLVGFALLPAMQRKVGFDENALLPGSAQPTLR